jgi:hypothetical protein
VRTQWALLCATVNLKKMYKRWAAGQLALASKSPARRLPPLPSPGLSGGCALLRAGVLRQPPAERDEILIPAPLPMTSDLATARAPNPLRTQGRPKETKQIPELLLFCREPTRTPNHFAIATIRL